MSGELVLVTGGSGFIGTHCILQLLGAGYRVRTSEPLSLREAHVRSTKRARFLAVAGEFITSTKLTDCYHFGYGCSPGQ